MHLYQESDAIFAHWLHFSFIYHLQNHSSLPWVYGGEYDQLADLTIRVIQHWIAFGLAVHFVFDGMFLLCLAEVRLQQLTCSLQALFPSSNFPRKSLAQRSLSSQPSYSTEPHPHPVRPHASSERPKLYPHYVSQRAEALLRSSLAPKITCMSTTPMPKLILTSSIWLDGLALASSAWIPTSWSSTLLATKAISP